MTKKKAERSPADTDAALAFIKALFGDDRTKANVYFSSLANNDADPKEPGERRLATRDAERVANFVGQWDKPDRGLFFCVGTVTDRRAKDEIVEIIGLHADIDFKGVLYENHDEIYAAIDRLKCKPTALVRSGHGAHLYWLFKAAIPAQANRDRVETLLKLVCDHVAGDPQVCEISRLMRLPGTHNTKFGSWVTVECVYANGPRYELADLEAWLGDWSSPRQKPILQRRGGDVRHGSPAAPTPSDNPFIRMAQEHGVKTPIDVDARLATMRHGGAGDTGVHATQLQVSAALIERGMAVDAVVEKILAATQALPDTGNWDWRKERRELHTMCLTWLNKHPKVDQGPVDQEPIEPTGREPFDNVHKIHKATKPPKAPPGSSKKHIVLALGVLQSIADRGERLLITQAGAYWYSDGLWDSQDEKDLKRRLNKEIEVGAAVLEIPTNNKLVNEAREWLLRRPEIYQRDIVFDAHEKVPVINGLVDPRTGEIEAPLVEHYATWRIEHAYNPAAKCQHWLLMLHSVLADRPPAERKEYVELIQELLGVGLINARSKSLSRALVFVGAQNTGKSGLLDVLGGLFGTQQNLTPLNALDSNHGLMPFLQRRPWILHEAFDEGVWHLSSIVKSIISGDPIAINVKNGPIVSQRVQAPIFWATNHPPAFKETTRAIIERMVIVQCRETFEQDKPVGVAEISQKKGFRSPAHFVIETEMEGVLAWAIEGLKRALARGYLVPPKDSKLALEELQRESNVAIGFCETCINIAPAKMVSLPDFCAAFRSWYIEEHDTDRVPSSNRLGRAMTAMADKRIAIDRELRSNARRYYGCISLNAEGLKHWKNAVTSDAFMFKGRTANTTSSEGDPNVLIPDSWRDYASIQRARLMHGLVTDPNSRHYKRDQTSVHDGDRKQQNDQSGDTKFDGSVTPKSTGGSKQPRF